LEGAVLVDRNGRGERAWRILAVKWGDLLVQRVGVPIIKVTIRRKAKRNKTMEK